jgi:lipopolysaccharide export system protein LptC
MLARSIGPTGSQASVAIPDVMTRSRVEAFGRAERHSRRVRGLKLALPLAAVAMAAGFVGYSFLSTPGAVSVEAEGSAFTEGKLVMANPKLEGFTKDGRPYSMVAARAVQDFEQQGIINLEGIDAKMPVETDNWARVEAKSGIYDRTANTLDVKSDILVTTTDGMVAKLKSAFLDISKGSMKTADPVDIQLHGSRITADSMAVLENGKRILFETRVRMNIDPTEMKAAQAAKGGTDASN